MADYLTIDKDVIIAAREAGGEAFRLCYQCGTCTATCPWNRVKEFIVRRLIHQTQLGLVDFEGEDIWNCSTCLACVKRCPRGVEITDVMRSLRRLVSEWGVGRMPDSLRISMTSLASVGNPWLQPTGNRGNWAEECGAPRFDGTGLYYFACCALSFDARASRIARATTSVLNRLGEHYGILGEDERCCGESARKAGGEGLFENLASHNAALFSEFGVKQMLVSSPHCLDTFNKEYAAFGANVQARHFVQYIAEKVRSGELKFTNEVAATVTYHDPCFLGRYNDIYDDPRDILKAIPGLKLVEMANTRADSLCCGGGGGHIWMEAKKGENLVDVRVEQALATKATMLVTACPYCILNFDGAVLTLPESQQIEVRDISELVAMAMG